MRKELLALIVLLCSFLSCTQSQNLDNYLKSLEEENKAMGNVFILKDGKQVYNKSIGFANIDLNKKNNLTTKFRIGSISKTFTATIILQLIKENKLSLDTQLSKYFSGITNSEKITISDMLYHRSGIYNITNDKNFEVWISEPRKRKEMLDKIMSYQSLFVPNSKTEYSNSNYVLLAYIAEDVEGKMFKKILKERIIDKLSLKETDFGEDINFSKNEAMCYYPEGGKWHPITFHTNLTGTMGAGGIISNAKDVSIFYNALFTGEFLSENMIKKMTTPQDEIGMGISVVDFNGMTVYGHNGAIDGFRSAVAYFPKLKLTICLTFNASSGSSTRKLVQIFKSYLITEQEKNKY
ncbi:serine hydrolase domain-containing protein [uncultured Tenacibaculum sp.]|uniref:serine hydrolase domain-containing protein n=1 Tax=uncultured Tenacibaculum sp. TaxID=174713 RepID=UPI002639BE09|nr:serine hydrolase domain-containing protein [uncultured Tenacibaculum sp.]